MTWRSRRCGALRRQRANGQTSPIGGSRRAGSLLPITLLILSVSVVLTFTSVDLAVRASRRSRHLLWSDRLMRGADEGVHTAWQAWNTTPSWTAPVGTPEERVVVTGAGDTVHVTWRRTHPLIVWVQARASATVRGLRMERSVQRVVWLGAPVAADSQVDTHGAFASRYPAVPWDGLSMEGEDRWRFVRLQAPRSPLPRTLRYRGWVVIDGGVHLADGSLVEGLLVVRGALRVTGQATIRGDLVVLEGPIPPGIIVRRDRYATEMALATAARPRLDPFHLWYERP